MQNRFIKNITPCVKILITFLIICTLAVAKSLFLIAFITILSLIILIMAGGSVNKYVDFIKKIFIWLLFIVIMYIIIYKSITGLVVFMYKIVLSVTLIDGIISRLDFDELHSGIYGMLTPLRKFNINVESKSFNIALNIVFLKEFLNSSDKISESQLMRNKRSYGIKYFFFPRLLNSIYYVKNLEDVLQLKFYSLKREKINFKSVISLLLFIFLFVVAIFKEVIL